MLIEQPAENNGVPKRVILSIKGWNAALKLMGARVRIKRIRNHPDRFLVEVTGATEKPEIHGSEE